MTGLPGGLLVPEDFLQSRAFIVFATFVAINTIVYLGLTAAKIVPWPSQVHPDRVRTILPAPLRKEAQMPASTMTARRSTRAHDDIRDAFRDRRRAIAARTIPLAFAMLGGLVIVETALNAALGIPGAPWQYVAQVVLGALAIALAQVAARGRIPAAPLSWTWSLIVAVAVANLSYDAVANDSTVALAYALVCMAAILPVSVNWAAGTTGTVVALASFTVSAAILTGSMSLRWILAALFAILLGAVLLYIRGSGIDSTTLEQLRSNTLATTDPLTGCFTRRGLLTLAPGFSANARRADQALSVTLVDIEGLAEANADYGLAYGDDLIEAMGRAVGTALPKGDLLARWTGRSFLALGMGDRPDAEGIRTRIDSAIAASGIALGKRPVEFRVRTATAGPDATTLEDLVAQASGTR